ncbi:MAG: 7-carboxy-7-deazaguanine synthase QueE [Bacteroidia bacterium]
MREGVRERKAEIQTRLHYGQADPLPVMEQFYTLQGEGGWTGTAAYFVRLAGCDVGCTWCDVKASWVPEPAQYQTCSQIAKRAHATGAERVVITGGEPTIYDLRSLCTELHSLGIQVHMETAGVHPLQGEVDWVCFSPKKFLTPQPAFYQQAHELKVVIYHERDIEWAELHAARCAPHVQLFLQPEWSRRERITPLLIDYIRQHPRWRLSLQTHKYIDIP